jgi:plasmid stability protein
MPRKRSDEGKPMNASGEILKTVRLELPADIHKELRVEAAQREMSMASLARVFVEEGLAKAKKPKSDSK